MEKYITITSDFDIIDFDQENIENYEFTKAQLDPENYEEWEFKSWKDKRLSQNGEDRLTDEQLKEIRNEDFEKWANENLSWDELFEIPLMNSLYYYPDFVDFTDEDRKKVQESGAVTLLYDNNLERWAIGMTGGGMDLTPFLADAFIRLGKCIPENIARNLNLNYNAYVEKERHTENCSIIARSFFIEALRNLQKVEELGISNNTIKRHAEGLKKIEI